MNGKHIHKEWTVMCTDRQNYFTIQTDPVNTIHSIIHKTYIDTVLSIPISFMQTPPPHYTCDTYVSMQNFPRPYFLPYRPGSTYSTPFFYE